MNRHCKIIILTVALLSVITVFGLMALDNMLTKNIAVGVSATEISPANYKRTRITLFNNSANIVYLDNGGVDCTTDSFVLKSSTTITLDKYQGAIWGIVDITTSTVSVLELQY